MLGPDFQMLHMCYSQREGTVTGLEWAEELSWRARLGFEANKLSLQKRCGAGMARQLESTWTRRRLRFTWGGYRREGLMPEGRVSKVLNAILQYFNGVDEAATSTRCLGVFDKIHPELVQ